MKALLPLVLGLLSCSSSSTSAPPAPVNSTEQKKEPSKSPAPAIQPKGYSMIFERGFFRSSAGDVIALVPSLSEKFSAVSSPPTMKQEFFFIYSGTQKEYSGYIAVFALPPMTSEADAFSVMHELFAKGLGLAPTGDKKSLNLYGGASKQQMLAGQLPNGTKMSGETLVIMDSGAIAGVLITSVAGSEGQFGSIKKELIDSIRVGGKIPALSRVDPKVPLEGFFRGPLDSSAEFTWMVFDPEGHVSDYNPSAALFSDLPVLFQWKPYWVGTYFVEADKLVITWPGRTEKYRTSTLSFKKKDNELEIDEKIYRRVDGPACDGLKLSGSYEASSYSSLGAPMGGTAVSASSSSSFVFSPDGTFRTSSSVSVTGTDVSPTGTQTPSMVGFAGDKDKGTYRVEKNLIYLTFGDGTKDVRTFFPRKLDADGKPNSGGYIINGTTYLLD